MKKLDQCWGLVMLMPVINKQSKTKREHLLPHIPLRFKDAIAAALETPPERKPKKKAKGEGR